ncbi:glycosyltransferase family 9 protein [Thermodesulfobacteriota bacterium]
MRVLIIKLSAFGDIIHSLSVIDCLNEYSRLYNKEVELHWLVEKKWAPILRHHENIDKLIISNTKGWRKSILSRETRDEFFSFWKDLRGKEYDLVIDINGLLRSAVIARLTKAKNRVGFSEDSDFCREKYCSLFLDNTYDIPRGHVIDQTVGLMERVLDIKMPDIINPALPLNESGSKKAREILADNNLEPHRFAIIAAGGGWETKLLDAGSIASFCDKVAGYDIVPVLAYYGIEEGERAGEVSAAAKAGVKSLSDLPVDTFIEIMRLSRLVIGPDTGTVHASSAVMTPTVSYYGPSSGDYSGPRRETDRVVQISPECGPCFKRSCENGLCSELEINKILDAIDEQLG